MENSRKFHKRFSSMFQVSRAIAQNIPNIAWTVIQWNIEYYDELDEQTIIAPWTFIPKETGYYRFDVIARIDALAVNDTFGVSYFLNGIQNQATRLNMTANAVNSISLSVPALIYLIPTDSVDVRVWHNFGAIRTLAGSFIECRLFGYRVR